MTDGDGAFYRAFVSYSHRDGGFARSLHRRLETYALPRRLVGRPTRWGPAERRGAPIFRDREELPAAEDLSTAVRDALARSRALIVVCSPDAAASPWVSREIELFRALHPDRPILAALARGTPAEAFPEPLRRGATEPLAADFRPTGDGSRLGLLKLVAGVVDVRLDELIQRDAQRGLRRVTAVTAAAVAGMLAMGALTMFAFDARSQAESQRAEAEGLVEYMLTDLRPKLEGVGRLDVLSAVNARALRYYGDQDLRRLPPASLMRRARVLHAMGEDEDKRGDSERAMADFKEARRSTAALMDKAPDDPEAVFTHAQSEYWLAYVDLSAGRTAAARKGFLTYLGLAQRMTALAPSSPRYRRELGYALGNLCTVDLQEPVDAAGAVRRCEAALAAIEQARDMGVGGAIDEDLINRHAWLADAYRAADRTEDAFVQRQLQGEILDRLVAADPRNMDLKQSWVGLQRAQASLEYALDRKADALSRLRKARDVVKAMHAFDPANTEWTKLADKIELSIAYLEKPPTTQ